VISYEFVKEVLHDDAHPEMTPSTFPEVHTVSGEKLPLIGQIQVTLLLNGRQFPSQFHVITNMAYQAVLGRDFLQSNGAIINYSEANKLDKTDPLTMTQREENSRALAILTIVKTSPVARSNDDDKFLTKLPHYYSAFLHRCKKARHFFLKFLLLLLLMSPHGHVNSQINQESTTALLEGCKLVRDAVSTKSSLSTEHFESKPPSRVQANHHLILQFLLTPVRLKDSSTIFAQSLKLPEEQLQFINFKNTGTFHTQIHESQYNYQDKIPASREQI